MLRAKLLLAIFFSDKILLRSQSKSSSLSFIHAVVTGWPSTGSYRVTLIVTGAGLESRYPPQDVEVCQRLVLILPYRIVTL